MIQSVTGAKHALIYYQQRRPIEPGPFYASLPSRVYACTIPISREQEHGLGVENELYARKLLQ
jgi:hypothetical protein